MKYLKSLLYRTWLFIENCLGNYFFLKKISEIHRYFKFCIVLKIFYAPAHKAISSLSKNSKSWGLWKVFTKKVIDTLNSQLFEGGSSLKWNSSLKKKIRSCFLSFSVQSIRVKTKQFWCKILRYFVTKTCSVMQLGRRVSNNVNKKKYLKKQFKKFHELFSLEINCRCTYMYFKVITSLSIIQKVCYTL